MDGDESCVGIKNVTINEPFFQGHFPQYPGHAGRAHHRGPGADGGRAVRAAASARTTSAELVYFMGIDSAKFRKPVVPGDQLHYHVRKIRNRGRVWRFYGEAKVNGQVVAEAEISAMLADTAEARHSRARMAETIHPTAIVEAGAKLGAGVQIGPFCVVGADVDARRRRRAVSHVVVAGRTTIGARTRIFPFASIGHQPQDLKYKGEPSTLDDRRRLPDPRGRHHEPRHRGRRHVDRPSATAAPSSPTRHVGHDCHVGNNVIFSNNVMLAGHCTVGDFAIIGGGAAVIQFARVGAHAFLGGMSGLENDLIPYGMALGNRAHLSGLNIVGLQRRGFSRDEIHDLRRAYRLLFAAEGTLIGARRGRGGGVRRPSDRAGDRRLHPRRRQALAVHAPSESKRPTARDA